MWFRNEGISLASQAIFLDEAEVVLAGGTESMSQAPYLSYYNQQEDTYSQPKPAMLSDGLTDVFSTNIWVLLLKM